jgi:ABC-type branched-subunit amino acid transport system permease subunit
MKALWKHPVAQVAAVLVLMSLLTLVTHLPLGRVTQIAIYVLYAAGIGLLVGYLGLVPFGGSVFFGLASYAAALSLLHWFGSVNEFAGLAFSVLFTTLVALPVGALILRRKGLYFSLLSLACTQICFEIAYKWTDLTGGENGLQRVPRPVLDSALGFHVFVVLLVLASLWFMWRLVHSPLGRLFQAIRDNEQRAASLGYDVYHRAGGRHARALHARCLCQSPELGACGRRIAHDRAGRHASFHRCAVGRHPLHRA